MRHIIAAAILALAGTAATADPIEDIWQTQPDEGAFAHVTITPCGGAFCGTITRAFKDQAEYRSPNVGRQIVIDMAPQAVRSMRRRSRRSWPPPKSPDRKSVV